MLSSARWSLLRHGSRRSAITKLAATALAILAFAPAAGAGGPLARAPDPAGPVAPPVLGREALSEWQYQQATERFFALQGQYHAAREGSEARRQRGSNKRAGPAQAISRAAHSAVSIPSYVFTANFGRSLRIGVSNCPRITMWISVQNCSSKSARIAARGRRYQSRRIQYQVERAAPSRPEGAEARRDTRLMLQIGGLLALAYGVFLALWLWATRVRPRMRRGARV